MKSLVERPDAERLRPERHWWRPTVGVTTTPAATYGRLGRSARFGAASWRALERPPTGGQQYGGQQYGVGLPHGAPPSNGGQQLPSVQPVQFTPAIQLASPPPGVGQLAEWAPRAGGSSSTGSSFSSRPWCSTSLPAPPAAPSSRSWPTSGASGCGFGFRSRSGPRGRHPGCGWWA